MRACVRTCVRAYVRAYVRACVVSMWMCVCTFLHSLTIPFQARDTLSVENVELHAQLEEAKVKIHALQQHLDVIRDHTIGFILEQMNTLHNY